MTDTRRTRLTAEDGFTLMELMVVVLIIAILVAIVIPTFFSARNRADNRAAQSGLRDALVAAKAMYSDGSTFAIADASSTGLVTVEPNLSYVAHDVNSNGPKVISVQATPTGWAGAVHSHSGNCYWIREVAPAGISYGGDVNSPTSCSGDDAAAAAANAWP
jgi:type IV pilus assembly protein PilA